MGLFDYVDCEAQIPIPANLTSVQDNALRTFVYTDSFQTKDLDNTMTHYLIKNDGVLKEKFFYSEKSSFYQEIDGPEISQTLNCYGIVEISEEEKYWIEYTFTFLNGKMIEAQVADWNRMEN